MSKAQTETLRMMLKDADYEHPAIDCMALDIPCEIWSSKGRQVILSVYTHKGRLLIDVEDET